MRDIVQRLRSYCGDWREESREAADEIERLREELAVAKQQRFLDKGEIKRLREELEHERSLPLDPRTGV